MIRLLWEDTQYTIEINGERCRSYWIEKTFKNQRRRYALRSPKTALYGFKRQADIIRLIKQILDVTEPCGGCNAIHKPNTLLEWYDHATGITFNHACPHCGYQFNETTK